MIGGHAGGTILPLLSRVSGRHSHRLLISLLVASKTNILLPQLHPQSQTEPAVRFTDEERDKLTLRIQNGGTEVVEAKAGSVSAAR